MQWWYHPNGTAQLFERDPGDPWADSPSAHGLTTSVNPLSTQGCGMAFTPAAPGSPSPAPPVAPSGAVDPWVPTGPAPVRRRRRRSGVSRH